MRSNEFQHDEGDAVSPVIATILMVAITVVLAGVLYVWASSLAEGNTGGSLTVYQVDAAGDVGASTTGTDDPLVRITMTQGVAINWATVDVKISINNGAPITCDNPGNEGGAACALIEFGDSTDSEWSVGDGVTVVESGQDLCNAVCSVKITITDVREGRTIDESSAAIQGGTGGSGDGTTPSNDDQQSSGGCTEDSDCSGNELCNPDDGTCNEPILSISDLNYGDLVINEVLQNPAAVSDNAGEWFEIWVNDELTGSIDLEGLVVYDDGSDSFTVGESLIVSPGDYVVFGKNADSTVNGGVTLDYEYGQSMVLGNGADALHLKAGSKVIDEVAYDGGLDGQDPYPDPSGASMILDANFQNDFENDYGSNWCVSSSTFGSGDYGTPGAANDSCD